MALTPEDVVNKRFQPTKFREGYDQDEVDDFLDEIVVELRRLTQENDELRRRLSEAGISEGDQAVPAPVAAAPAAKPAEAEKPKETKAPEVKKEETKAAETPKAAEPAKVVAAAPAAAPASGSTAESAAGVLAMAQRLHDEYVSAGVEQRDKIIAEAQVEATGLVTDAEEKSRKTLSALEQQKTVLERKVEQLRGFERDYRARLKTYIEGQLRDLEAKGSMDTTEAKDNG
ncbi:DivIVA domain-containing protein [Paeniglutamicibacter gangotriensis]|uniref:Cell wall synthesis protein Wag31 n=1 Tax=Paeniglutamicibacter gangotriensis Lz1y TaxID=1276920 RepID=M7N8E4_9MICC|nr:DivIVA domain-containing protein [Paeniglutamicibacter gangotriensis]EMQ98054.1 DivIVA domain-containing protein [Paeniglutamicibacter gangotriensis Lz1y]